MPQNRERYFVVGIRDDIDAEFVFPTEQHDYVPKLSSVLETNVDEKYYISDEKARTIIDQALKKLESLGYVHATITPDRVEKRQNGRRAKTDEEPRVYDETSPTLRESRHGVKVIEDMQEALQSVFLTQDEVAYCCDASYFKGISPSSVTKSKRTHVIEDRDIIKVADISKDVLNDNERQRKVYSPEGISPTLLGRSDGPKVFVEEPQTGVTEPHLKQIGNLDMKGIDTMKRVYDTEGIAPTLTACGGGNTQAKIFDYDRYRVRKLTPTEYGRLQGFPMDTWNQVVSNSQAYKQFGNAVTTTVAKAIAERIKEFLDENLPLIEP